MSHESSTFRVTLPIVQFALLIGLWQIGAAQKKTFCEKNPIFCNATDVESAPAYDAIVVLNFPLVVGLLLMEFVAPVVNLPDWISFAALALATPFFWYGFTRVVERIWGASPSVDSRRTRGKWVLWICLVIFAAAATLASVGFLHDSFRGRWLKLGAACWSALAAAGCLLRIAFARGPSQLSSTGSG
jgi:hypothetical protein